jgi:catechol 2,3-dioxygenase-like lactoylglutathione lyase family enzyme
VPHNFLHVSFLVPNLEEAAVSYGRFLGVRFREPLTFPLEALEQTNVDNDSGVVRYCYSEQGAPYYELIEAVGQHVYGPHQGFGFHHVGMWMDDEKSKRAELAELDVDILATARAPDGHVLSIFTEAFGPLGLRIEFMNRQDQAMFEHFFATGEMIG